MRTHLYSVLLIATATAAGRAQTIKGAVLAIHEPHHHLAYQDSVLRVLRVRVPAHDTTLLHEHGEDYFWIALGPSTIVNAKLGAPDASITSADLSMHYTPGKFAHVARNPGDTPFDNITVELLRTQTHPRNLCETAVAGAPLDCPKSAADFEGATEHPALTTDQLRVSLLTIPAGGRLRPTNTNHETWLIALVPNETQTALAGDWAESWVGGTLHRSSGVAWSVPNNGRAPARVIAVTRLK